MKRAITILQDLLTYEEEAEAKVEIRKAIAELKATQARLDNLRDYCNSAYVSYPGMRNILFSGMIRCVESFST